MLRKQLFEENFAHSNFEFYFMYIIIQQYKDFFDFTTSTYLQYFKFRKMRITHVKTAFEGRNNIFRENSFIVAQGPQLSFKAVIKISTLLFRNSLFKIPLAYYIKIINKID